MLKLDFEPAGRVERNRVVLLAPSLDDRNPRATHLACAQVVAHPLPPFLDVGLIARDLLCDFIRFAVVTLALAREELTELVERPEDDAVGSVIEHLPNNLTPDARV